MNAPQPILRDACALFSRRCPILSRPDAQVRISLDLGGLDLGGAHFVAGALDVLPNALQKLLHALLLLLSLRFDIASTNGRGSDAVNQA